MKRLRSIDIFRGICIFYMTWGHMINWWISQGDFWLYEIIWNLGAPIGGGGFLLVSGMSASISFKRNQLKAQGSQEFSMKRARNAYMVRCFLIFLISLVWNFFGTLFMGLPGIWVWFVLQAIAISLFMAWPFLKTSRIFRISMCFVFWIGNEFVFYWLAPYSDTQNVLGYLFYFLYNTPNQNVILGYFPFLLLGTVFGDIFFESNTISNQIERKLFLKKKIFKTGLLFGVFLVTFGLLYKFPDFSNKSTFASRMFIVGVQLILIAFLVYIKEIRELNFQKRYRFFEIYSFYSFTLFLAHHLFYFLFPPVFNFINIWYVIIPILIAWTFLFRFIYIKLDKKASIKFLLNKTAVYLADRIEIVKSRKQ
ncbi:MAG: hypothetical protein KGD74_03130 [Candidatus Lokiarchaeota archaeon]|nr:hypothetical protein [Candidatus Lokiarchaeota archaeon]